MKFLVVRKALYSILKEGNYGEIISQATISDKEFHFMLESFAQVRVEEIEDECIEVTLFEKNKKYTLAKGYIGNFIKGYKRKTSKALVKHEIDLKFHQMKRKFAPDLVFNSEIQVSEIDNEYMLFIFDESESCGLYLSFDGKYIYGIDGGHLLCDGLWSEYFKKG